MKKHTIPERTVTTYDFSELEPEVQRMVIEKHYNWNVDHMEWWETVYMDAERIGLKITHFDLDCGREIGIEMYATKENGFVDSIWNVYQNILKDHGPDCDTTQHAKDMYRTRHFQKTHKKLTEAVTREEHLQELGNLYLAMLDREYDYLTSDEAIKESIEANEMEFLEDGTIY